MFLYFHCWFWYVPIGPQSRIHLLEKLSRRNYETRALVVGWQEPHSWLIWIGIQIQYFFFQPWMRRRRNLWSSLKLISQVAEDRWVSNSGLVAFNLRVCQVRVVICICAVACGQIPLTDVSAVKTCPKSSMTLLGACLPGALA